MKTSNRNIKFASWLVLALSVGFTGCTSSSNPSSSTASPNNQSSQGGLPHTIVNGCDEGATPFGGGTGSASSPFLLCSAPHVQSLQTMANPAASYLVVNDIDLTGVTIFSVTSFTGVFDGGNHTLSNMTGVDPIFNNSSGTIKNLNLKNVQINGGTRGASLANTNLSGGQIINCSVTGTLNASYMPGGMVGVNQGSISKSFTNMNVTGYDHTGGLVGVNQGTITECHTNGPVKTESDFTGGLVGQNSSGTITNSYATGQVSGNNSAGGLAGDNSGGTIQNCYSLSATSGASGVGGLVGTDDGTINFTYAAGNVAGTTSVGGLIGSTTGGTTTNSYWDTQSSSQASSAGGTGEVTAAMQTGATFAGWDFTNTWNAPSAGNYPSLH